METKIVEKVYSRDRYSCFDDIVKVYKSKGYVVVNFLYFYNFLIILNKKYKWEEYGNALLNSDFILPDGIALRLFLKRKYSKVVFNLNGTDFVPFFINSLVKENKLNIVLYGAKKEVIKNLFNRYKNFRNIVYWQDGYSDFDWKEVKNKLNKGRYNILLVALGTPKQELWIYNNLEKIKNLGFITFGVGGLFDFLSGSEKRAPKFIRRLYLERLWRALVSPRKNFKKAYGSLVNFVKYII